MAIGCPEVDPPSAIPAIEHTIIEAPGSASVRKPSFLNALENGTEFGISDMKSIMMALEGELILEQKGEGLVDAHGRKMIGLRAEAEAKYLRKNARTLSGCGQARWCGSG